MARKGKTTEEIIQALREAEVRRRDVTSKISVLRDSPCTRRLACWRWII
jgi:hypothetical protein